MKTKSGTVTAKQRFQTKTLTRDNTSTVNDMATARIALKAAPNTSASTSRVKNTVKVRFGTRMARATRVAGWKIAGMATVFTTT